MKKTHFSPLWLVLCCGIGILIVLVLRGLNIGALHTDVIIHYAWFDEFGIRGFPKRYFDVNQRHVLVGPVVALVYRLFGTTSLPYHLIFQASRVFEGAFLAGNVFQLSNRRLIAACAGLALTLTPLRLPELYQGINWYIEATLPLLLASTYTLILALKSSRFRWLLLALSFLCYSISVLIYEAGLPWIGVNLVAGWLTLEKEPWRARLLRLVQYVAPLLLVAITLALAIVFVFEPWGVLKPQVESSLPLRLAEHLGTALTFPALYYDRLQIAWTDGYILLTVGLACCAGFGMAVLSILTPTDTGSRPFFLDIARLAVMAITMLFCSVLVGTSNPSLNHVYVDRITFGRSAGISLLVVTLLFGSCALLRTRWHVPIAATSVGLLLIGPGLAWLLSYQDYAQKTRHEIERMTNATLEIRKVMVSPVHIIVVTGANWPGARFPDAVDVITHEVQQNLWERGGDATIDIIKKGNAGIKGEWETKPGSCDTVSGESQAGTCLGSDQVRLSRWSFGGWQPHENVVVVRYDHITGTMTIVPEIQISDLTDYNITTAGPHALKTNPERLVVPLQ